MFPVADYVWSDNKDTKVTTDLKGDKRHYTGDCADDMEGDVVCTSDLLRQYTERRLTLLRQYTEHRLTSLQKPNNHLHFHFTHSPDLWSNLDKNCLWKRNLGLGGEWVHQGPQDDYWYGLDTLSGEESPKCVWLLTTILKMTGVSIWCLNDVVWTWLKTDGNLVHVNGGHRTIPS